MGTRVGSETLPFGLEETHSELTAWLVGLAGTPLGTEPEGLGTTSCTFDICLATFSKAVPTLPQPPCPEHHQNCPGDHDFPVPRGIQVKAGHSRGSGELQREARIRGS